ncbi:hypothetical protein [Methanosarcina siciliae]|uniref:hypothetical protein n=1 Tax=Methanosarcina siciliae TaxID=38027 RepID=UPI0018CCF10C|nr:hypothetical protein [Methanosarcina siciliae]
MKHVVSIMDDTGKKKVNFGPRPHCPLCSSPWDSDYMKVTYIQKRITQDGKSRTKMTPTGDLFCEHCRQYFRKNDNGEWEKV